ncbi:colanic acid/amylovoran biosynthesis protein [Novosphingobium chloroacetimidivorans]|uniref:Colanic acid/amylovoran biosynthesis protein n=1 Tax=Novosphingobium chloroacetimidivorans TaxID=1428314 RepID=A0A7W7KE50_9SPHN|nr:polysaccharide pyruvyl transferase family protein [Novosphingobium chloroacetimidivorans]MBB4860835.1 colanic acid/amylovoran biosynthesis protein [Novosphingobium chloroacetimidivorans]
MSTFEIKGINFDNHGAAMMLLSVRERLGGEHRIAVEAAGDYDVRAPYGLHQILRHAGRIPLNPLVSSAPRRLRSRVGLIIDSEIDAVLDASGFAYGDDWGAAKIHKRLDAALVRRARTGMPVILLPQAMGPFNKAEVRNAFARVIDQASLIYVRDASTQTYVEEAFGMRDNVRRCPDFTIGLQGLRDPRHARLAGRPAIVPNHMVVRNSDAATRRIYVDLLASSAAAAKAAFGEPFVALHDARQDAALAVELSERLGTVEKVTEHRPQVMKGILADSAVVVGSRFHALVAALSHGTPVIAFGWSHKYAELLTDFGCSEALVKVEPSAEAEVLTLMERIVADREAISARLQSRAAELKAQVVDMWDEVALVLQGTAR